MFDLVRQHYRPGSMESEMIIVRGVNLRTVSEALDREYKHIYFKERIRHADGGDGNGRLWGGFRADKAGEVLSLSLSQFMHIAALSNDL